MPLWRLRHYHHEDFLSAIEQIRPTLTPDMLAEFERGKEDFARL